MILVMMVVVVGSSEEQGWEALKKERAELGRKDENELKDSGWQQCELSRAC